MNHYDLKKDRLGWDRLTNELVEAINLNKHESGFTIGIKGKWGAGKSSLLNFVEKEIEKKDFIILRYNPWLYPHTNHVEFFFRELAKKIENKDAEKKVNLDKIAQKFEAYADYTKLCKTSIMGVLKIFFMIIAVAGVLSLSLTNILDSRLYIQIGSIISILIGILGLTADFFERLSFIKRKKADWQKLTLSEFKNNIGLDLKKQNKFIVVIIDDIDRLPPKEICEVFQIVKNNGDIPNITYLLAFDDDIVKAVLKKEYDDLYNSFTEKIVQLAFTLPPPDPIIIRTYFTKMMDHYVMNKYSNESLDELWDDATWSNQYYHFVQYSFDTFRDIKRIINGIRLNIPLIFNKDTIEVNPNDFIAIEIIRIKYPFVYDFIKANKDLFVIVTKPNDIFMSSDDGGKSAWSKFADDLSNHYCIKEKARIINIITELFPPISRFKEMPFESQMEEDIEWRRKLRICAESIFDRYFLYANYEGDISSNLINEIILNILRKDYIDSFIDKYKGKPEMTQIMERLAEYAPQYMGKRVNENDLILFLFAIADYLPADIASPLEIPVRFKITNFVEKILENASIDRRENILKDCIQLTTGIFGPVTCLAMFEAVAKEGKEIVPLDRLNNIRSGLKRRLIEWLRSDNALSHPHFIWILFRLKDWLPEDTFSANLGVLLKEQENIKKFLCRFFIKSELTKPGNIAGEVSYKFDFDVLDKIIPAEEMYNLASSVDLYKDKDSDNVFRAFEYFRNGIGEYLIAKENKSKEA